LRPAVLEGERAAVPTPSGPRRRTYGPFPEAGGHPPENSNPSQHFRPQHFSGSGVSAQDQRSVGGPFFPLPRHHPTPCGGEPGPGGLDAAARRRPGAMWPAKPRADSLTRFRRRGLHTHTHTHTQRGGLKRGGAAAHLEPITRDDLARRYGYFLDFLARRGLLPKDAPAATAVTPENVDSYIAELKARVSSVTVYGSGIARPGAGKPDMAGFQHGDAAASRRKVRPADHCKAPAWLFPGRSPHAHTRGEAPSPSLAPLGRPLPARAARGERLALRLFAHADLPPSRVGSALEAPTLGR
jgi:hypothetical protein